MATTSLNNRIDFSMWVKGMQQRFQSILAGSLTDEEKLALISQAMEKDVQEKRVLARSIRAQMCAIADPETPELEPLEAATKRREKLVNLGGRNLNDATRLGQIQQEIKAVDALIASNQRTYDTLQESYQIAFSNYQIALAALEHTRQNGPAMLKALKAHRDALKMRDQAKQSSTAPDMTFMTDLEKELNGASAELRADKELDDDLNAEHPASIDAELAKMDAEVVDEGLMAEFKAAAEKSQKS